MKKLLLSLSTIAMFLFPVYAFALGPFSFEGTRGNGSGDSTVGFSVTPPTYAIGDNYIFYFHGLGDSGQYNFLNIGSGLGIAGGNLYSTIYTIETPQGFLSDTLNYLTTNLASATSTIAGLGSSSSFNMAAFMVNSASTTPFCMTSTLPGFDCAQPNWTQSSTTATDFIKNKPVLGIAYEGTTQRVNSFPIFKSATITSGVAVVYLTADNTSTGTALCTNGVIQDSVSVIFNDSTKSFQQSWAFTNSNKTLTITASNFTTASLLSGILGQVAANGSVAKVTVWCY